MNRPGLSRALPYGFFGFVGGVLLVVIIRGLQSMDTLWDPEIGFIVAAFTTIVGVIAGVGAFDPRMNVHGDHAEEVDPELEEHPEKEYDPNPKGRLVRFGEWCTKTAERIVFDLPTPRWWRSADTGFFLFNWIINIVWFLIAVGWLVFRLLLSVPFGILGAISTGLAYFLNTLNFYSGILWRISAIVVVLIIVLFAISLFPTGLRLETSNEPNASFAGNGFADIVIPFGGGTIEGVSQLSVFIAFIAFTLVSLAVFAGLIALLMYKASQGITETNETEITDADITPPAPVQVGGQAAGVVARILRNIPKILGYNT